MTGGKGPEQRSVTTVFLYCSVAQMLAPSKATECVAVATTKVPTSAPSLARNLVREGPMMLVDQMFSPSEASQLG